MLLLPKSNPRASNCSYSLHTRVTTGNSGPCLMWPLRLHHAGNDTPIHPNFLSPILNGKSCRQIGWPWTILVVCAAVPKLLNTYIALSDPGSMNYFLSYYRTVSPQLGDKCVSNVALTVFHTQNLSNHTFFILCSPFPGRRCDKQGKLRHRFVPQFFWPSPRNWRPTMHCNVVLTVFLVWWYIFCVLKFVRTTFWQIVVSQSWGDCSIMWENFMNPGSESATYPMYAE